MKCSVTSHCQGGTAPRYVSIQFVIVRFHSIFTSFCRTARGFSGVTPGNKLLQPPAPRQARPIGDQPVFEIAAAQNGLGVHDFFLDLVKAPSHCYRTYGFSSMRGMVR